ncbi:unnamed protein product, partial [marine sediment metagenome]
MFSARDTLLTDSSNLRKVTIDYWLTFFEELDKNIGELKAQNKLHIIDKNDVKNKEWTGDSPFPTSLADRSGRLNIRFDTNGILFGVKEVTEAFIGGLFNLFQEDKLNNLFIEIDYSFKGATPKEYRWSQRQSLPVDPLKISFDYATNEHPQLPGFFHIVQTIENYVSKKSGF